MINRVWKLNWMGVAALAVAALLAGCGESTNIQGDASGVVSDCSALASSNVTCVPGRLIDDAAGGVDYECSVNDSLVRSVTDADGSFSCPNGSKVTFSLINPTDSRYKIVLGSTTVTLPAQIYGDNSTNVMYFYVTPRDLAGDSIGNNISVRAQNITRLLQTLSDDTTDDDLSRNLPSRRVVISDATKSKITEATQIDTLLFSSSIASDPTDPPAGSFDAEIKPFLTALADPGKAYLITGTQATRVLTKGINSTVAGMYLVPGGSLLTVGSLNPSSNLVDANASALVGYSNLGDTFIGSIYALVDRRGRTIGSGVYSYGSTSVAGDNWSIWSNPQAMDLSVTGVTGGGFNYWPLGGDMTSFAFDLRGAADSGVRLSLTQGLMKREAIAGSAFVYNNLFRETGTTANYGRFALKNSSGGTDLSGGAFTLVHQVRVAPLISPDAWNPAVVSFPLPVTISFYNRDYGNAACDSTLGCKIADVRMVILEDGNIISDRFGTCGVGVDPESLLVGGDAAKQEIPLGVVASLQDAYPDANGNAFQAMALLAMLPNDSRLLDPAHPVVNVVPGFEEYVPYLQFNSNIGDYALLRVAGGADSYKMYGYCPAALATLGYCSAPNRFETGLTQWVNAYTYMRAIKANKAAPAAAATQTLIVNRGGLMTSARTPAGSCPP